MGNKKKVQSIIIIDQRSKDKWVEEDKKAKQEDRFHKKEMRKQNARLKYGVQRRYFIFLTSRTMNGKVNSENLVNN